MAFYGFSGVFSITEPFDTVTVAAPNAMDFLMSEFNPSSFLPGVSPAKDTRTLHITN